MSTVFMSQAQKLQLQRIQNDEKISAQEQLVKSDHKANLNARWSESLEEICQRKMLKKKLDEIKKEVKLANKSLTEIRRAQLKKLLEDEHRLYEQELHDMGLTFYKERL